MSKTVKRTPDGHAAIAVFILVVIAITAFSGSTLLRLAFAESIHTAAGFTFALLGGLFLGVAIKLTLGLMGPREI